MRLARMDHAKNAFLKDKLAMAISAGPMRGYVSVLVPLMRRPNEGASGALRVTLGLAVGGLW